MTDCFYNTAPAFPLISRFAAASPQGEAEAGLHTFVPSPQGEAFRLDLYMGGASGCVMIRKSAPGGAVTAQG